MIIGITGLSASGKDTVAEYLKKSSFVHFSCSDIIREACRNAGQKTSRVNLIEMGKKLRTEKGNAYLTQVILKKKAEGQLKNIVVTSLRHPDEVTALDDSGDFYLAKLNAPIGIRFQRTQKRKGRPEDKNTFEEFKANEERERTGTGAGQQLDVVMEMADYTIINDASLEEFYKNINQFLENVKKEKY